MSIKLVRQYDHVFMISKQILLVKNGSIYVDQN